MLILTFGPCVLNKLVAFVKDRLNTVQLMVLRQQYQSLRRGDTAVENPTGSPKRVTDHRLPDQQKEVNCGNSTGKHLESKTAISHKVKVGENGVTHAKPGADGITQVKLSTC